MFVFPETAARAAEEAGVRAVLSRGLTGGEDDKAGGERRIREARDEIMRWRGKSSLITYMLGPHAPYTCDPAILKRFQPCQRSLICLSAYMLRSAETK
jgi:5-methylthioadenosine/S-adenosylhomocysteine deaminase